MDEVVPVDVHMRVSLQIKFPVRDVWNIFEQATSRIFLLKKIFLSIVRGGKARENYYRGTFLFYPHRKVFKDGTLCSENKLMENFLQQKKIVKGGISVFKWFTLCSCFFTQYY